VTPVFNASYGGLFKSFVDALPDTALTDKPVLIAATGGTARHSLALEHAMRPLFTYLRALVVPTSVFAAPEDWAGAAPESGAGAAREERAGAAEGALNLRIRRAAGELARQLDLREPAPVTDPFALPASFEDLLAGG
jgi:FMN reductase